MIEGYLELGNHHLLWVNGHFLMAVFNYQGVTDAQTDHILNPSRILGVQGEVYSS